MSLDEHYAEFLKGIEQYNTAMFFECHDTWEEIWHEIYGSDKKFLHGLIQVAIALYHLTNRNPKGARSMFAKAFAKLERYQPAYRGVAVTELMQHVQTHCMPIIEQMERGEAVKLTEQMLPKIYLQQ
jgi:predicted metal-dependent hydrolase